MLVSLTDRCIYKGIPYKAGDQWDDGCDFTCECLNGKLGQYKCEKRSVIKRGGTLIFTTYSL